MSTNIKTDLTIESQKNPLEELATELAVDVEALEERLEMIGLDVVRCCVVNVFCHLN